MKTVHGRMFFCLDRIWANTEKFFHTHKTLVDLTYIGIYSLEQFAMIILIIVAPNKAHITATLFALLLMTTVTVEKLCMESRYHRLRDNLIIKDMKNRQLEMHYNKLCSLAMKGEIFAAKNLNRKKGDIK